MTTGSPASANIRPSQNESTNLQFPKRLLTISMIISGIVFVWLLWQGYSSYAMLNKTRTQYLRIEELRGTIMYYDEVLTASVSMAATTGDVKWEERFNENLPKLEAAIEEALVLAPNAYSGDAAAQTDAAIEVLTVMETDALEAVKNGRPEEAQKILFSPEYAEQKQLYADGMTVFSNQMRAEVDQALQSEGIKVFGSMVVAFVILGASLFTWRTLMQHLNRWRAALVAEVNDRQQTVEHLKQTQREAEGLRQQEKASRQQLEQTVAHYLAFTNAVAQGKLQERLDVQHDGAIGQLGQGLNGMVASLQSMTQQVQQASANIASAAAEILASTSQQAASATEQSAAITQTTTTVEEVKAIAQQTAQQANQLVSQSHQVLDVAHQGTQAVDQTVDGMGLIRERVDSIANTILALSEQTTAIGEITQTVTDLADQSNLLALNAAIEAARAGEHGKGFAVVAQHVRELAERSKSATAQVGQILNEIQRATSAAVMVTEEGTKGVTQGAELAGRAGQVITRIAREVESGTQANMQVAAAAQQQTAGMDQIGQAMGAIQQATTETLSSTRQAEKAAKDLSSLAQSLQQAVAAYQV